MTKPANRWTAWCAATSAFGKTEVALRAAFIAVMGGKQVAILAPTTLLAEQHAQTFADRLPTGRCASPNCRASAPARRSTTAIKGMADGTLDIVIGTHKLLLARRQVHPTWAWSSSTKNTASACARKKR